MWIFDATFERNWLLTGSSEGELVCWDVASAQQTLQRAVLEVDGTEDALTVDSKSLRAHSGSIYCLATHERNALVFTGAEEEIRAWRSPWNESAKTCVQELKVPQISGNRGALAPTAETNAMAILKESLVAASGDGNAYMFDIESGKMLRMFPGNDGMLHACAAIERTGLVVTGSEGGMCKLWDLRAGEKEGAMASVDAGDQLISALAVSADGNWLAFGGSQNGQGSASLVHLTSRLVTETVATSSSQTQALKFTPTNLLIAGSSPVLEFWSRQLTALEVKVPTSCQSNFVVTQDPTSGVITVGGSSNHVDLFSEARDCLMSLAA